MRILVCGGRNYNNQQYVSYILSSVSPSIIIHGNAAGADECADCWARANHVKVISFPPDWGTFGKSAGPRRNQRMIDEGKPDLVIAFPGERGTADMIRRARLAGIPVKKIE